MRDRIAQYFATLADLIRRAEVSDSGGAALSIAVGFERVHCAARSAHADGNKIMFVGNGGSSAISSHLAIDYSKNGGLRALAFNDAAALTCLGNDLGYEHIFAKQIELHARPGDLLVAISSSGRSKSILNGVASARGAGCRIVTFTGFDAANELRGAGEVNFYVRSNQYGFVEVAHLALCHAILDLHRDRVPAAARAAALAGE